MCVLSGDPLANYGPVLWCLAALWSQVKGAIFAPHVYVDLISRSRTVCLDLMSPVLRVARASSPIFKCVHVSSYAPLVFCGALSAKLSEGVGPLNLSPETMSRVPLYPSDQGS